MKIIYLAPTPIPSREANTVHVMKMAQALSGAGHDVVVVAPEYNRKTAIDKGGDPFAYYGVRNCFSLYQTQNIIPGRAGMILHLLQCVKAVLSMRPDLVYARSLPGAWACCALGVDTVFETHALIDRGSFAGRLFASLPRFKSLKKIVSITHALKGMIVDVYNIHDEMIYVAPDGADAPDTPPPPASTHARIQAGYIGHLYPGRGIDIILSLAAQRRDIDFHVIGGTDDDLAHWRAKAKGMENITFYGHLPHGEIQDHYTRFDILLAPYQRTVTVAGRGDTSAWMSPLKIFEYMSSARAIICSDIPVLREVLEDRRNCLLCPPDNLDSWLSALDNLAKDPDERTRIGEAGHRDLIEKYSWSMRAQGILSTL